MDGAIGLDHRDNFPYTIAILPQLRHETGLLSQLVRAYVATADARYLLVYYDILAIRQGDRPAPEDDHGLYWEHVMAGLREHRLPEGVPGVSLGQRLQRLQADTAEQAALTRILEATEALGRIEQVAFAATQGLYDPRSGGFVSEGRPDPAFARDTVHSPAYARASAALVDAVGALEQQTERRTTAVVETASQRLRSLIRNALKEGEAGKPPKAYREIYQMLREVFPEPGALRKNADEDDENDAD